MAISSKTPYFDINNNNPNFMNTVLEAEACVWLQQHGIDRFNIRLDGRVNVGGDVQLPGGRNSRVMTDCPVRFGHVQGHFRCSNTLITRLDWLPEHVGVNFDCSMARITSFHDIHKHIKFIGNYFLSTHGEDKTHLLGLLLIKGIRKFMFDNEPLDTIMNKYIGTGDIIAAQDEMIDAGFMKQARL